MNSKESITRSVILSAGVKTISRIVGMIRTLLIASYFGATVGTDGFQISSGIVFFFFLFLESALELTVVPDLSKYHDNLLTLKKTAWGHLTKLLIFCLILIGVLYFTQNYILDFLIPIDKIDLRASTLSFLPTMVLGSIAYILYRFICLVERAQGRFSSEIFSDLFLSCVMAIYIWMWHTDINTLGESYLAANLAALVFIFWRSKIIKPNAQIFSRDLLGSPGPFFLFILTGILASISLMFEKKLGAYAPSGALTIYAYATVIYRFMATYGVSIVQIFHPSFHQIDGHKRFLQLLKLIWLYSVPTAFVTWLSADFVIPLLFSSRSLSTDQLQEMVFTMKLLSIYLFSELVGNTQIRYVITHGGLKIYNILYAAFALLSFAITYSLKDILNYQVLLFYNLLLNGAIMVSASLLLNRSYKLIYLRDYAFLAKLSGVSGAALLISKFIGMTIPSNPMAKSLGETILFTIFVSGMYLYWVKDEINDLLLGKIKALSRRFKKSVL